MSQTAEKFIQLSHLRKLRRCEQVAAVCYRIRDTGIEFLLVHTRSGRWTFPKGSTEPGLSHAQAAALEAFEEAGVHGRIEEIPFTRYTRTPHNGTRNTGGRSSGKELAITVHLCEVLRLNPPQEFGRNPTWFSAAKAKRRLREGRKPDSAAAISHVIDQAVARIEKQRGMAGSGLPFQGLAKDALQRVQFEAPAPRMQAAFIRYIRHETAAGAANGYDRSPRRQGQVLQINAASGADEDPALARTKRRLPS